MDIKGTEEPAQASDPSDGLIDFSGYFDGRFSIRDGFRGWLSAMRIRSPVYGSGSLKIGDTGLVIDGWKRTWLGNAVQTQVSIPYGELRHIDLHGSIIDLLYQRAWRGWRRIQFSGAHDSAACACMNALAQRWQPASPERSREISEFNARLREVSGGVWVTPTLCLAMLAVYGVLCTVTKQAGGFDIPTLTTWGANSGSLVVNGQWWRLFSTGFLHLNLAHLLLNLWAFWNVGRLTERIFGSATFLFLFTATLLLSSLSSIAWNPALVSVGASGAIFGILGAFLAFFLNRRNQVPPILARQYWISAAAFVLFNLVSGLQIAGIDNAAHVGGLCSGLALGWLLSSPLGRTGRSKIPAVRIGAAAGLMITGIAAAVWQIQGPGSGLTPVEQYLKAHSAYAVGEAANLRLWNELGARAASGSISDQELGERFKRDVLPFWQATHTRLEKDNRTIPANQKPMASLVAEYVTVRRDWVNKIIEATGDRSKLPEIAPLMEKSNALTARIERLSLQSAMSHRSRALASSPLVLKIRQLLSIGSHACVNAPAWRGETPIASDDRQDGPSVRYRLGCEAQHLFSNADYGALEVLMNRTMRHLDDLPDGSSSFEGIIAGLDDLFSYGAYSPLDLLGKTADWRRRVPGSVHADVLDAFIFSRFAWAARGGGYAASVTPQAWAMFSYRTEMAAAALDDTRQRARADPAWYMMSMNVGLDRKADVASLHALHDEGSALFPDYLPLHRAMLRILMPRWGGSYKDEDAFISRVAEQAPDGQGAGRYATLYSSYARMEGDEVDLFADTFADWKRMQKGFEDLEKRHPASDFLLNEFVNNACRANDAPKYRSLRPTLEGRYSSLAWTAKYSLKACDLRFPAAQPASIRQTGSVVPARTAGPEGTSHEAFTMIGGVRVGMTTRELLAAKGPPAIKMPRYWNYNTVDERHDGVLTALLGERSGTESQTVEAVSYVGNRESAPAEVPYLKGSSRADLIRQFGKPAREYPHGAMTQLTFPNGVYANLHNDAVIDYGIFPPH